MSSDARDVVLGFCDAWERSSLEDVLGYMAPDIVYANVPIPAMNGVDEAAKFIAPIIKNTSKIQFEVLSIAVSAAGDEVLTERVDRLHFPGGIVEIPLMGIFRVRDGKISEWRDYSDNGAAAAGFAKANVDLAALLGIAP